MGKRSKRAATSEFPILDGLNLYAASTKGDGNCLFRALSDQVYGDESHHGEIRQKVVAYTRENSEHFAAFVGEFGETFEQYISRLSQDGVYGGHIEIVGFADTYNRPVVIYQAENLYIVEPQNTKRVQWEGSAHIAYHTWEHYSSVRKTGDPPNVPTQIEIPQTVDIPESAENTSGGDEVPQWKVDIVMKSVPDAAEGKVRELLRTKDYDIVIEELIMSEFDEFDEPEDQPETIKDKERSASQPNGNSDKSNAVDLKTKDPEEAAANANTQSMGEPSAESKVPINRKQEAKQRRAEKKERVRAKKDKSKKNGGVSKKQDSTTEESAANAPTLDQRRIIHI